MKILKVSQCLLNWLWVTKTNLADASALKYFQVLEKVFLFEILEVIKQDVFEISIFHLNDKLLIMLENLDSISVIKLIIKYYFFAQQRWLNKNILIWLLIVKYHCLLAREGNVWFEFKEIIAFLVKKDQMLVLIFGNSYCKLTSFDAFAIIIIRGVLWIN
jgi:hypothetical protein